MRLATHLAPQHVHRDDRNQKLGRIGQTQDGRFGRQNFILRYPEIG